MSEALNKSATLISPTNEPEAKHKGLRYNEGKLRYDLFEPHAMKELAKVFTIGANKYAPRNWERGMSWQGVLASLERHKEAFKSGEDIDQETGCLHMAHVAWNALALVSYYSIYPQGDDRDHEYLRRPKIGLDIDEVLCDWVGAWCEKFGHPIAESWSFSYDTYEEFKSFTPDELNEFYLNIPRKIDPKDMPFEPHCYITSRSVPVELTQKWLEKNGFPCSKVYSVGFGVSKIEVAKQSGIDVFVDDRFENFVELNRAGICTYLLDALHNQRYEVGYKRIKSLKELVK